MTQAEKRLDSHRLNTHEEDNYGKADAPKSGSAPSPAAPPAAGAVPTQAAPNGPPATAAAAHPRKACRHHIDESIGGAHH